MDIMKIDKKINIKGLTCPYTFVKSKLAVEDLDIGQVLEILLDSEEAARNIPKSMEDHGHKILRLEKISETDWVIQVRKDKE
ncbi:MAG TPA: sulfurtransferase TusA family protein [Thermodesulfovibrionales bacterium]|nr:sulfurtransferase TusA family protein [Thermodesulfovibrionales bacterium]